MFFLPPKQAVGKVNPKFQRATLSPNPFCGAFRDAGAENCASNRALPVLCPSWIPISFSHPARIASTSPCYFSNRAASARRSCLAAKNFLCWFCYSRRRLHVALRRFRKIRFFAIEQVTSCSETAHAIVMKFPVRYNSPKKFWSVPLEFSGCNVARVGKI